MNNLPNDIIELIYYKLHRLYMAEVREELCGADEHFFWIRGSEDGGTTDESYSCTSSDSESD